MMKRLFAAALLISMSFMLAATSYQVKLDLPVIKTNESFSSISLKGGQLLSQPGEPALPWLGSKLLLPLGEEATKVNIIFSNPHSFKLDKPIQAADAYYPFSQKELPPPYAPDAKIYSSSEAWPELKHNGVNTQFFAGHPINFTAFCPFDYFPAKNELVFYSDIHIQVESQSSAKAQAALNLLKQDAFIQERLNTSIDNSEALPNYQSRNSGIEYLIIHDADKLSQWQALKDFYLSRGLNVAMKSVQSIQSQSPGADLQEKIRNHIISVYQSNPLRYVLLAGDTDVIPHRGFYVNMSQSQQVDADIPADMYYSCLDGNWNSSGNNYWGEVLEADLAPELAIGRICYNNDAEIANQINKIMLYHIAPVESELKSSFFVGEWLWEGPTWGGDYMDEMIGGSNANGYVTTGVPNSWNITTLYDRTYGSADSWNANQVRPMLSQGANLVNHLGHSATTYTMRLSNNQVSASTITNDGGNHNFSIYFTQGCYAGAFDNRTTNVGEYTSDSITEKLTSIPTAAVSMISHSRYGWGMQGSTDGPSQYFHRQYIDAIFGENIYDLGWALVDSKIDNIPYTTNSAVMYWVTYETNLIGDPALNIWTDTPQSIVAQLPPMWSMSVLGYQIATNAPFSTLRIKNGETLLFENTADASGLINVNFLQGLAPGNYQLYITAPNFYAYETTITVQANEMPYVVATNIQNNDSDGLLHSGEEFSLGLTLKNMGSVDQSSPGTLSMSSNSPNIRVLSQAISFDAIAQGDSLVLEDAFTAQVIGSFEDGTTISLIFTTNFDGYSSSTSKMLTLNAPEIKVLSYSLNNSNSSIYPGDTPSVNLTLKNSGSGNAQTPFMILFCDNPMVNVSHFELHFPAIQAGEEYSQNAAFSLSIPADLELGTDINVGYMLSAENGPTAEGNITVHLGLPIYNFESDMLGWDSYAPNTNFTNQWHRSSHRNHSSGGAYSMKFGGQGSTNYANRAYGALESPEFILGKNSMLKFFHRMDAEAHTNAGYAWDGGFVQMKLNGGAWVQIDPVGGYPRRIYNNPASPLSANTYCWSGSFDWTEAVFDLSEYSGTVIFRFIFGSDGAVNAEGWYIDDVHLEAEYIVDQDDPLAGPEALSLRPNFPNPFNPSTTISFALPSEANVQLDVYNLKGQRIKRLINKSMPAGNHSITFDGLDDSGRSLASGMYLYKLKVKDKILTRKMMLMK